MDTNSWEKKITVMKTLMSLTKPIPRALTMSPMLKFAVVVAGDAVAVAASKAAAKTRRPIIAACTSDRRVSGSEGLEATTAKNRSRRKTDIYTCRPFKRSIMGLVLK